MSLAISTPERGGEGPLTPGARPSPRNVLMRYLVGNQVQQAIHVAASLRVADALADGPMYAEELAPRVGAQPQPLRRLLRTLASLGVFGLEPDGRFALTPISALLRDGTPDSLRAFAIWSGSVGYQAFGSLDHTIRTGAPAFEHLFGAGFFEYLAEHPDVGDLFDDVMSWNTRPLCPLLAKRDFSAATHVVDLGGGRGELLAAVLSAHGHLRGTLVDRRVTPGARATMARAGIESRCELLEADIVNGVPIGADVYVLKSVLHGLDDANASRVLDNCRRAMTPDGTLLVVELVLPDGNEPSPAHLMDLLMLIGCDGRERTSAEFERLFAAAGFEVVIQPGQQAFSLIEARVMSASSITR